MAKGYWVGRVDVTDEDKYRQYVAANAAAFENYHGRFLVRGGGFETVEGESRRRNIVIEFDSYQQALDCYHSDEYQYAKSLRAGAALADLVIVEGYESA